MKGTFKARRLPDWPAMLRPLKGAIKALKEALESGDHDAHLAELLEAEKSGKARAGAIKAIEARM